MSNGEIEPRYNAIMENVKLVKKKRDYIVRMIKDYKKYDNMIKIKWIDECITACNNIIADCNKDVKKYSNGILLDDKTLNEFETAIDRHSSRLDMLFDKFTLASKPYVVSYEIEHSEPNISINLVVDEIFNHLMAYEYESYYLKEVIRNHRNTFVTKANRTRIKNKLIRKFKIFSGIDISKIHGDVFKYGNDLIVRTINEETIRDTEFTNNERKAIMYADMMNCIITIIHVLSYDNKCWNNDTYIKYLDSMVMLDDPQNYSNIKKTG